MIPLEDAFRIIDETLAGSTLPGEVVPVRAALGRTLAADQRSRLDLPQFNKSAMDGYAVAAGDERETYRVLETVAAGAVPAATLQPGTTVKVMTGAPVPAGTGRVIKIEDVQRLGDFIQVQRPASDVNVCPQGEDVRRGDVVLSAGRRITALDAANLIGCGVTEVEVYRAVRVALFATGDEIVDDPAELRPGRIMNSNGPLMAGLARGCGLEVFRQQRLSDDRQATASALRTAREEADLVVFSGGVSVGDFDFVGHVLQDAGLQVHFDSVAVKPGRPTTFASASVGRTGNLSRAVFGLPGNPVSVYLGFQLFVLRAASRLMHSELPVREFMLPLAVDFVRSRSQRTEYVPCRLGEDGRLERLESHGSAHLTALRRADGFFIVPVGVQAIVAGQRVRFAATGLHRL